MIAQGDLRVYVTEDVRGRAIQLDPRSPVWIDLERPTDEDIDWLRSTFQFHPIALEDVTKQHQRPKLDRYGDYYFGVLYEARMRGDGRGHPRRSRIETHELQFFWGPACLITIHRAPIESIQDLRQRVRDGSLAVISNGNGSVLRIADLAYWLIDMVVDGYFPVIDQLAEWNEDIEDEMFSPRRSPATLQSMFSLKKDLFHLRKVLAPSREVINILLRREHDLFGEEFYPYIQDIYDHINRVVDSVDTYRDLLSGGLETYLSFVSNDVNQTVKRMTAVTAILMVDALIVGNYGMNFTHMPELGWQFGYPFALSLMLVTTLALFAVFRRIRWF